MKTTIRFGLLLIVAASVGCSTTPTFQQGPGAEVTHDGLTRLDNTVMDAVWARTDIDLSEYNKIMFDGVGIEFREVEGPYSGRAGAGTSISRRSNQTEFALDEETQALFRKEIGEAFAEEMGESKVYTIVDEPGHDVLLVRGGLLDVVSRIPPETVGRSRVFLDSVGEATLVLEIRSSVSNTIYARAVDRRAMEQKGLMIESNRATNRAEVRRLGRQWARILREGLEQLMSGGGS
ncbi:MAG: DUF3313 family protein [Woeseiaceae bacterium]|nr:DUF3313 family protein [Woeseiaceae bacterium]